MNYGIYLDSSIAMMCSLRGDLLDDDSGIIAIKRLFYIPLLVDFKKRAIRLHRENFMQFCTAVYFLYYHNEQDSYVITRPLPLYFLAGASHSSYSKDRNLIQPLSGTGTGIFIHNFLNRTQNALYLSPKSSRSYLSP